MSQIEELQRRIVAAMDRIGTGVNTLLDATLDAAPADSGGDDALRAALSDAMSDMTGGTGISPADSAAGLIQRIDELNLDTSGGFWHAEGYALPW